MLAMGKAPCLVDHDDLLMGNDGLEMDDVFTKYDKWALAST